MSSSDSPDHPGSILYHSKSSEVPYSTNWIYKKKLCAEKSTGSLELSVFDRSVNWPHLNRIMTITLTLAPRIFRPSYVPLGILPALKIGNPNGCLCNPDVKKNFVQENYQGRWNWQFLTDQSTLSQPDYDHRINTCPLDFQNFLWPCWYISWQLSKSEIRMGAYVIRMLKKTLFRKIIRVAGNGSF